MGRVVTDYVSDHTKFINEQLEKHPEWVADQQAGRALWWDRPQSVEDQRRYVETRVPQKAYPYDVNH